MDDRAVKNKYQYFCTSVSEYHQYVIKICNCTSWNEACAGHSHAQEDRSGRTLHQELPPYIKYQLCFKIVRRHAAVDLRRYIDENKLLDPFQSAYRPHHGIETALVHIYGDIMQALDRRKGVILILIDLTAAINTVDLGIPLKQMKYIGICESALNMLLRLRMPFLADNN